VPKNSGPNQINYSQNQKTREKERKRCVQKCKRDEKVNGQVGEKSTKKKGTLGKKEGAVADITERERKKKGQRVNVTHAINKKKKKRKKKVKKNGKTHQRTLKGKKRPASQGSKRHEERGQEKKKTAT